MEYELLQELEKGASLGSKIQKLEFTEIQFLKTNFKSQVDGDLTIDDHTDFDRELYISNYFQTNSTSQVVQPFSFFFLLSGAQSRTVYNNNKK